VRYGVEAEERAEYQAMVTIFINMQYSTKIIVFSTITANGGSCIAISAFKTGPHERGPTKGFVPVVIL
jgi:hypothetical protein